MSKNSFYNKNLEKEFRNKQRNFVTFLIMTVLGFNIVIFRNLFKDCCFVEITNKQKHFQLNTIITSYNNKTGFI